MPDPSDVSDLTLMLLREMRARFDRVDSRFDRLEDRADKLDANLGVLGQDMSVVKSAVRRIEIVQDALVERNDNLRANWKETDPVVRRHSDEISDLRERIVQLEATQKPKP